MTSTSETSGSSGGVSRRYAFGRSAPGSLSGTSDAGSEQAKRPGEDSSKTSLSYEAFASLISRPSRDRRGQRAGEAVDLLAGSLLRHRHEQAVAVAAVERLERQPRQDLLLHEALDDALRRLRELERELLEKGRPETEANTGYLAPLGGRVVRLGKRQLADGAKALLAHDGEIDGSHQGAERHVGADV